MKKLINIIITIIFVYLISACAGYKPLYTTNLQFEIKDYSLKTNKELGKKIYSKIRNLSKKNESENNSNIKKIAIIIDANKNKSATAKDSTGKILGHKIIINGSIQVSDYVTKNKILNYNFSESSIYIIQSKYSETIKLENKNIENLINKIYKNILIKMSENMTEK
jgi:hypothetical protein|tara:strand:- start:3825 stop:4322 length:498 start_codon:yes stop_codon:yes gene_type:complete